MRRLLLAAPLALLAYGDPAMATEPLHPAPTEIAATPTAAADVSECVVLSQADVPAGIEFTFVNSCEAPVRCEFSWALRCDADEATGASPRTVNKTFNLQEGRSRGYIADAADCGDDGWMVSDDLWDCVER